MQKILFFVLVILGILFLGSFSGAFGEMMSNAGVPSGDVFHYSYTCYFNSNNSNAVPPASFSWINQTDYFMINVTGVSGPTVNFNTMMRGLNGSLSSGVDSINVGSGVASMSGYIGPSEMCNFYFMSPNVGMMGRMFPSSTSSPTINDTLMMSYMSGQRLTDHFTSTTNQNGAMVNSDFYFDQATGMMVQWRQQTIQTSGNLQSNSTQIMKITSSSVWTIPEFPTSLIVPIFIVAASASTFAALATAKFKRIHPIM
jgi:hypothetical protein